MPVRGHPGLSTSQSTAEFLLHKIILIYFATSYGVPRWFWVCGLHLPQRVISLLKAKALSPGAEAGGAGSWTPPWALQFGLPASWLRLHNVFLPAPFPAPLPLGITHPGDCSVFPGSGPSQHEGDVDVPSWCSSSHENPCTGRFFSSTAARRSRGSRSAPSTHLCWNPMGRVLKSLGPQGWAGIGTLEWE